uniref:SH3 and multiple ankyrin repeat domains 2a n=1 Tax=Salarias fasciatus TaxID=181472 RepID=A0A672F872_SALFA
MMSLHSGRASAAMLRMLGCANGRSARHLLHSDCVVDEKTVLLHKKDSEGFGFVLRGAKADTPIEEFTPTPAFPALQYLDPVDEGGVAWQAGLRTGDFLIEVNQENVVKVGHRQVVNMIRQGGNRLLIKVVTVSRNLDPEDTARKKAPPPPKRAPTTALSMRSKSMTSELEELGESEAPTVSVALLVSSPDLSLSSVCPEDDKHGFLTPPLLKFSRSLSMPDTSEDIPPPPAISPPSPPAYNSAAGAPAKGYGAGRPGFAHNSPNAVTTVGRAADAATLRRGYFRQSSEQFESSRGRGRTPVPENPYSEVGNKTLYVPAKPARRKGMLVKQSNVEDSPEKTGPSGPVAATTAPAERTCSSIPIPTIIVKEPSTSSSGKSSQGSSMEIEPGTPEHPPLAPGAAGLRPDDPLALSNPFAAAIAGAVRDREKRLEAKKNSVAFQSVDIGDDEPGGPAPAPRLRQSRSIDEGMFGDERLRRILGPPSTAQLGPPVGGGSGNMTDFNTPEPTVVREPLSTRTGQCQNLDSPVSLPATPPKTHYRANGTYLHPVTGKPLDPNSPLALALAARDRTPDLNQPLFIDTKLRSGLEASFATVSTATVGRPGRGALRRQATEQKQEADGAREERRHPPAEQRQSAPAGVEAGLLMVHTSTGPEGEGPDSNRPAELRDPNQPEAVRPQGRAPRRRSVPLGESLDEPVRLPFRIPPPPLASVDIDEDFEFSEPLPPPLEFANSVDIPDEQAGAIAEMLQQQRRNGGPAPPPYHPHAPPPVGDPHRRAAGGAPPPDPEAGVGDSGIEEADPQHTETTSTVSSISTLSSEGGFCESALETLYAAADGHAFLADRPPVPPKPKSKAAMGRTPLYHDTLPEEPPESYGSPPQAPPPAPPPAPSDPPRTPTQRTSRLWGDPDPVPEPPESKTAVISELSCILQHLGRDRDRPGPDSPTGPRGESITRTPLSLLRPPTDDSGMRPAAAAVAPPSTPPGSLPSQTLPCSPPDSACSSLPPPASPALSDVFGLPTPPLGGGGGYSLSSSCGSGGGAGSRSPSPLTLMQAVAASGKPFAAKPVELWSKHDVADWLDSLHLGEHRHAFLDNEIEGAHLPSLQKDDLIDLGVTRVGHRMNIERALKLLQDR